jgi:hypothetical protein
MKGVAMSFPSRRTCRVFAGIVPIGFCIVLASATSVQRADAAQVTFADRASFLGAVSGAVNYDFEIASGFPAAGAPLSGFASGAVTCTTPSGATAVDVQDYGNGFGQAIGGRSANGNIDDFAPVLLAFNSPRYAVGFDDLDLTGNNSEFAVIRVSFSDDALIQTYVVSETDNDFRTAAFFGIVSSLPIASVEVYSADSPNGLPNTRANVIDNVVLATPEPATLGLLAMSAGVLFAWGLRRSGTSAVRRTFRTLD